MGTLIALLVYLVIFCIVCWLGQYIIAAFVPDPIKKVAFAVFYIIVAIFVIVLLLSLVGAGLMPLPRLPR